MVKPKSAEKFALQIVERMISSNPWLGRYKEDMIQETHIGILNARRSFNDDGRTQFNTYAYYWIIRELYRYIKEQTDNDNLIELGGDIYGEAL